MTTQTVGEGIQGPAWDNSREYPGLGSSELKGDIEQAQKLGRTVQELAQLVVPLVPKAEALSDEEKQKAVRACQDAYAAYLDAIVLLWNASTYVSCVLSVDGTNGEAKALNGRIESEWSKLEQAYNPVAQFLKLTSDDVAEAFLQSDKTRAEAFSLRHDRTLKDQTLSLEEEDLLIGLSVNGPTAWGNLYDNISGTLQCEVDLPDGKKKVGLAQAISMQMGDDPVVRKAAYRAFNRAWGTQEESCAAILNALSGWRLDVYKRRSKRKPVHFLDDPLHRARITRETLDAMMGAVKDAREIGRRALRAQAKVLRQDKLGPWDLNAPCPKVSEDTTWSPPTFDQAIDLISESFGTVHQDMADFVRIMAKEKWIEGTVGPNKRPGAYCTKFPKSRTPRVYMTYTGSMREVKTLAHELGHAFHNWVMRDMPLPETSYPMTLAETASIFAETVVSNALLARPSGKGDRLAFLWAAVDDVTGLLINVPARFEFEKAFYEKRPEAPLNVSDFKDLMVWALKEWYGDTLSEYNEMFWATKLHFAISGLSFYNFPYTFGYLFSLGVYAQKDKLGDRFYQAYVDLLRDTGRMTAEDVATKHLGADLTKPDFWRDSLRIVETLVSDFEKAVADVL